MTRKFDPTKAKELMRNYVMKKGALAFGIADVEALEKIAPKGYGPTALLLIGPASGLSSNSTPLYASAPATSEVVPPLVFNPL